MMEDAASTDLAGRARQLRVDRILPKLFYEYGLVNYVSWSQKPDYRYTLIDEAEEIEHRIGQRVLRLKVCGIDYIVREHETSDYNSGLRSCLLSLSSGDTTLLSQTLLNIGSLNTEYIPWSMDVFEEGQWIAHLRALCGEARESLRDKGWHRLMFPRMRSSPPIA
jgi:hypothetical protein